jgi:hypothetical protein
MLVHSNFTKVVEPHDPDRIMKRGYFHKALAVVLGLFLFLAIDFSARQIYVGIWRKIFPETPRLRIPDQTFHHGFRPNWSALDKFGPFTTPYFSNSLGLRDGKIRDVAIQKIGPRIIFIGDSFTEGVAVPWEKTFVGRVACSFAARGIEVLNAGVCAYCPLIEKVKLRSLLVDRRLEVDRVIVFIDTADIGDEQYYEEGPDGKIREVPYGSFHELAGRFRTSERIGRWLERNVEKNFVILGAVVRNLRMKVQHEMSWTSTFLPGPVWPDYQGELQPLVETGLARAKASMSGIAQLLQERGVALTVAVYPWPTQVQAGTRPSRAEKEWSEWARQNGADFISLYPLFVNGTPANEVVEKYYLKGDLHWNEFGHELVARELLRRSDLILPLGTPQPKR